MLSSTGHPMQSCFPHAAFMSLTGGRGYQLEDSFFATALIVVSLLCDERSEKITDQLYELIFFSSFKQALSWGGREMKGHCDKNVPSEITF